jgi:hypothetical protein
VSRLPILVLLSATLVACAERPGAEASAAVDSASVARARAAADALGGDLVAMLTGELQRGGPVSAIAVCADSAQVRTARHALDGISVRRVGTRVRNAANAPDSTERAVLDAFAAAIAAGRQLSDTAFTGHDASGAPVVRYLRAIRLQEFCLACHGPADAIAPDVKQVIAARYPADQATGYAVGDLRGAISVTVPARR